MKTLLSFLSLLIICLSGYAQESAVGVKELVSAIEKATEALPQEKIFIHTDKPYYVTGDTLWLKAYLFNAADLDASPSGIAYLDLVNDTGKVVLRRMLPMYSGLSYGNIFLDADDVPPGSYTLRAYTSLMRNFGDDYAFTKQLYVIAPFNNHWLVSQQTNVKGDSVRMKLKMSTLTNQIPGLKDLQIRVLSGNRVLYRDKATTTGDGSLDLSFRLPATIAPNPVTLLADYTEAGKEAQHLTIPVVVGRNIDIQFMPEGGQMIAGIPVRIGVKAIGEDGIGQNVSGKIYRADLTEVASFGTPYKGMGSFFMVPAKGEVYSAGIKTGDGPIRYYKLPVVEEKGISLSLMNSTESDTIIVTVRMTPNLLTAEAPFSLIGQYAGSVQYAAEIRQTKEGSRIKIPKGRFPSGIASFTLFDGQRHPVSRRLTYIDHKDELRFSITTDKNDYAAGDSIQLTINSRDSKGDAVAGNFSIAVTDDSQVRQDSLRADITSSVLLSSELKGNVEEPGWYFHRTEDKQGQAEQWQALDNLLLTQGWVSYDWTKVFSVDYQQAFALEDQLRVKGKVTTFMKKPMDGVKVAMISTRPGFIKDTVTNDAGRFEFNNFPDLDTAIFKIQARNKRDRENNVILTAEEPAVPVFKPANQVIPWYVNTDTMLLKNANTAIRQAKEEDMAIGRDMLKTVTITTKKTIRGSQNLNGAGVSDFVLDEKDVKKYWNKTLLQLLEEQMPQWKEMTVPFHYIWYTKSSYHLMYGERMYTVNGLGVNIIMDGVPLDAFYTPPPAGTRFINDYFEYVTNILKRFKADDIRGIELMKLGRNYGAYQHKYMENEVWGYFRGDTRPPHPITYEVSQDNAVFLVDRKPRPETFIEITTRHGSGPMVDNVPGTFLYAPPLFAAADKFYSPKYTAKNIPPSGDLRSTIYWNPQVITDASGKATVSFFTSARKGNSYTVTFSGTDMNGQIGSVTKKVFIK